MSKNYYEILGVEKTASQDDIKKAYRKLAKEHHPDKNQNNKDSEDKFKEISDAYSILSDQQKRSNYDQFGDPNGQPNMGGFGNMGDFFNFNGGFNPFSNFNQSARGQDVAINITVSLKDVRDGVNKSIIYDHKVMCKKCSGHGGETHTCSRCNGSGAVLIEQRSPFGVIRTQTTCNICQGSGKIIKNPCNDCQGTGLVDDKSELIITIPKGVNSNDKFIINGKGHAPFRGGRNGLFGNALLIINVEKHQTLTRDGNNLTYNLDIPFTTIVLGGKANIPTIDDDITINIKPLTKNGEILRVKGRGVSDQRGQIGDLFITVNVSVPTEINNEEKKLIEKLSQLKNFK